MRFILSKPVVSTVLIAFVCYVMPADVFADETFVAGKDTADEAAKTSSQKTPPAEGYGSLRYAVPVAGAYAQPDTTEFDFPEEEKKHLARDITVFVIVSAFVAYFIIKVFLEGDKDENNTDDTGNGKPPPPV